MEFTIEKSTEQAAVLSQIQNLTGQLDIDYLQAAYDEMKESHGWRDSAAVLSPDPFTHFEKQDLEAAKLQQLKLYLELAKNIRVIMEKTVDLEKTKLNVRRLEDLF